MTTSASSVRDPSRPTTANTPAIGPPIRHANQPPSATHSANAPIVAHEIDRQSAVSAWSSPKTRVRNGFGVAVTKASRCRPDTIRSK